MHVSAQSPHRLLLTNGCAAHNAAHARRNIGHDVNAPLTRVYATPLAQPIHTDSADMVALLSLRLSREGGLSSWCSSVSVHNELLRLGRKVRLCSAPPTRLSLILCHWL